ncbi:hypothetical protein cand_031790 [Cryptosporidium andersoni]|uniref:Uncharacterized protein n=1 Tax=Cryptosporidium andersoni TaxID=117008 RepID=A0A1J4MB53_9CRYT|nr:hypothetical protein cand_031790 [Cryptosporidium andersoni]
MDIYNVRLSEIVSLQDSIRSELQDSILNRKSSIQEIQRSTEEIGNKIIHNITVKVLQRIETIMGTMEGLLNRCEAVEKKLHEYKIVQVKKTNFESVDHTINNIKEDIRSYYQCIDRITGVFIKVNEYNSNLVNNINQEMTKLLDDTSHVKIQSEIQNFNKSFENNPKLNSCNPNNQFSIFIKQELKGIQNALISATKLRQDADDDITNAIKKFTETLQNGLTIAVSNYSVS